MYEERLSLDYKINYILNNLSGFIKNSGCTEKELEEHIKIITNKIINLTKYN